MIAKDGSRLAHAFFLYYCAECHNHVGHYLDEPAPERCPKCDTLVQHIATVDPGMAIESTCNGEDDLLRLVCGD